MDINNNQQTNTFIKGMDTDTSDMYMGEGSYRYAENLRVVTNKDSNSGELHIIEGTDKVSGHIGDAGELLLGFTSIRNYIVEVVRKPVIENGETVIENGNTVYLWAVQRYDGTSRQTVAGWFRKQIWPDNWNGKTKPLSLVTRWESDDNVKLYIANGKTEVLSLNIANINQGDDFDTVFGAEKITLDPIKARVTEQKGASIPGVVIQYAYIVYKVNGVGTTLSMLSNSVVEAVNEVTGYKSEINGENTIELSVPEFLINKYIRVFRVAYSKAGQLPRVDVIYDQICRSTTLYDSGQSLQNVSSAEFVAANKLRIVPKEIESKGDYLFAGNVKYIQDQIDAKFDKFDARCFSKGNYYEEDGLLIHILDQRTGEVSDSDLLELRDKDITLLHDLFPPDNIDLAYDSSHWSANAAGYNGKGLCFLWRYVYTTNKLYFENQYNSVITPRTYARNEVYRFGVRLFDEEGNASSVKWIADIKMPDATTVPYTDQSDDFATGPLARNISIEFVPRNTSAECWLGVSRYEIVQAKRSINDSYKVTQGIVGFPIDAHDSELCLPYFLSTHYFTLYQRGEVMNNLLVEETYNLYRNTLLFASPEYVYLPDDIKALLDGNNFYCLLIREFWMSSYKDQDSLIVTYETEDPHYHSTITKLNVSGQELKYKFTNDGHQTAYLDWPIMTLYNQGGSRNLVPIGGAGEYSAKKNVYFNNVCGEHESDVNTTKNFISKITYIDAQDPEQFAASELPTYKNTFKTVSQSKKLFNWTNPAMFYMYSFFRAELSGLDENHTKEGWKKLTMTSLEDPVINIKTTLSTPDSNYTVSSNNWAKNAIKGSSALAFPMSPGGPMMALDFSNAVPTGEALSDCPPSVTVANIIKSATPYGGYNITSINNTQYVSGGYSNDKETPTLVSMGDNYITMFVYFLYHSFDNAVHDSVTTGAIQYIVPIESTIDLSKQCSNYLQATSKDPKMSIGKSTSDSNLGIWVQAKAGSVPKRFIQDTDLYMYNTAYSVIPDVITYSGQDTINQTSELYDSRIHYSQKKLNNELIDNWTTFKAIDYLDVDSRYGQITGLKLFKDKLIFLQENGAGVLSVNDRIILKDQESANIIVGNGGVLDRYDYFTTMYGMKPDQHVVEASNDVLYWWDGHRREILSYVDGYNVTLLLRVKNIANYINSGIDNDIPSIVYDTNNKEVLFNVVNDNSVVYNELVQAFTSVYTFSPIYYCNINGKIFVTDNWEDDTNLYEYNKLSEEGPSLFGRVEEADEEVAESREFELEEEEPEYNSLQFGGRLPIQLLETATGSRPYYLDEDDGYIGRVLPKLTYIVNKDSIYNKVFDILTFGGNFKGINPSNLRFEYNTPQGQTSFVGGYKMTDREYDYRLNIPRATILSGVNQLGMLEQITAAYGGRMRGKTMECTLASSSNDKDFSIQYITTKYRMSWT